MGKHKPYNDQLLIVALARHEEASAIARRLGLSPTYVRRIARGAARADLQPHLQAAHTGFDQELIRLAVPYAKVLLARHVKLGMEGVNETARKCREFVLHFTTAILRQQQERLDGLAADQAEQEQLEQEQLEQERAEQERARQAPPPWAEALDPDHLAVSAWLEGWDVTEEDELVLPAQPPGAQPPAPATAGAATDANAGAGAADGPGPAAESGACGAGAAAESGVTAGDPHTPRQYPQPDEDGAWPCPGEPIDGTFVQSGSQCRMPLGQPVPWPGQPNDPNDKHRAGKMVALDIPGRLRQYVPVPLARKLGLVPDPKDQYSRAFFDPHSFEPEQRQRLLRRGAKIGKPFPLLPVPPKTTTEDAENTEKKK